MTNNEIEAFLAVVRCGNISQAAQSLFVTQPALTRRIQILENELGTPLFNRQKGVRNAALTREGEAFLQIAEKWRLLIKETEKLNETSKRQVLKLSAIESVSSYIFPEVFRTFLREGTDRNLVYHNYHSAEAYGYVESGLVDLAFVSDRRFAPNVRIVPAFADQYFLAFGKNAEPRESVSIAQLDPTKEIRLPWTDEFDRWHNEHFDESVYPYVFLEQMNLMEELLLEDTWAFVPALAARKLSEKGYCIAECNEAAPTRIIYYLIREDTDAAAMELIETFLLCMKEILQSFGATVLL